jgi:hypothetical protein
MLFGGFEIDVIHAHPGAADHFQPGGCIENSLRDAGLTANTSASYSGQLEKIVC